MRYKSYSLISRRYNLSLNQKLEIPDDQDKNKFPSLKFKLKILVTLISKKPIYCVQDTTSVHYQAEECKLRFT